MSISIESHRAAIGSWHINCLSRKVKTKQPPLPGIKIKLLLSIILNSYGIYIGILLILRSGDVHPNPGPTTEVKEISICHVNIQSIYLRIDDYHTRKVDEIQALLINDHQMDIICLSETWLGNDINTTQVDIQGYKFHRKDRLTNIAGGVGMYITDLIPNRRANELEPPSIDLLWVEFKLRGKKILVGSCYRPPGQNVDEVDNFISELTDSPDLVFQSRPESIFLLGDFNDATTTWDSDHPRSELKLKLFDLVNAQDLHQLITEPTHYGPYTANILDLIITDSPGYVIDQHQNTLPPIGSKHLVVCVKLRLNYRRDKAYTREVWNYKKGDYQGLLQELEFIPWATGLTTFDDIDDMADYWQKSFMNACRLKIPNRMVKIKPTDKPWFNHDVKLAIRNRNRCFKRHKRTKLLTHYEDWKRSAREANFQMNLARATHKNKIKSLLMETSTGEKKYWKIAKQVYGNKKILGIPSLMVADKPITTSGEKAEHFNAYFALQQHLPPAILNQRLPPAIFHTNERLSTIITTPTEVQKILKSLDVGKANGSDGVSNRLLKETATAIASPLTNLFNKSFEMAMVPRQWKQSNICPIHKKEDKTNIKNYRPISLLSCIGKAQERVVYLHLYKYLQKNSLLTWKNSGFRELDSAINQLLFITDKIYKALESGKEVCMVFLDVSKAFDRVWHSGLLYKLKSLGIEGSLLNWLENYLQDRKIRVTINGQCSGWRDTNAGVPQGSILGPLLFLVFINDITTNIESEIHLFADDTSLMDIIDDHIASYSKLNRDLVRLSTWASNWLVTFNAAKTVYLKVSRKTNPHPKPTLLLDGVTIIEVQTHKHLGLTFNNTLTWSDHIANLVSKASRCVGLLRRISRDVPRQCLDTLYKAMILPIMEYADVIFDGSSDTHTKRLEATQRQAALA
jgi:hypothetical protein